MYLNIINTRKLNNNITLVNRVSLSPSPLPITTAVREWHRNK